ncbi:hypothetical protein E1A91_A11G291600v1 [Gossypium mustelinum]|uniref:Uncharacterized protein n=1 Tax=Gossypium mustelinum TaxID=34275 RepID=A0A5D2XCW5_GOSMU|nr:hypothetical protein E1A91_A11G291600v1 [Gossypium mustelinum]
MARPRSKSVSDMRGGQRWRWWRTWGGLSGGCSARVLCFLKVLLG